MVENDTACWQTPGGPGLKVPTGGANGESGFRAPREMQHVVEGVIMATMYKSAFCRTGLATMSTVCL